MSSILTTRRQFVELAAASTLSLVAIATLPGMRPAFAAETVSVGDLMAAQALPDVWVGKADAPVTIVEYASMTCPHCATFHAETYPALKEKYIDTGKVRFSLREFPLDPLATAGFMLGRCVGPDKRNAMLELLFAQQKNWAYADKPFAGLQNLVKQTGMSQEQFETCLKDKSLFDQVNEVRENASKKFSVNATPTFFINGQKNSGEMSIDDVSKIIDPLLKS
jgi:protein-disulfide isomerase